MHRLLIAFAGFFTLSCSPQQSGEAPPDAAIAPAAQEAPEEHPVSGLDIIPLTVTSGDNRFEFEVEHANTREAQARGLMFRTEMGDFEGMLFPSNPPAARSFWMKNTPLSLDIIFIGLDGRISNIAANTTPYSLDSVYSEGVALAVLELRGGRAAELGIKPGDRVEWAIAE